MGRLNSEPPVRLGRAGSRVWSEVVASCSWLAVSDGLMLEELCALVDMRAEMREQVSKDGLTLPSKRGGHKAHPLLPHLRDLERLILTGLASFGLTPADRSRLNVGEVAVRSKLQELMELERQP